MDGCHFLGLDKDQANQVNCCYGDLSSIPGLRRSPGAGNGYILQYSGLENSMIYIVHGVSKSQTFTFFLASCQSNNRIFLRSSPRELAGLP